MKQFERLWIEATPALCRLASRLAKGREDAEDLVSDTCLRALSTFETHDPASSFQSWASKIMARIWVDSHRRQSRQCVTVSFGDLGAKTELDRLVTSDSACRDGKLLAGMSIAIGDLRDHERELLFGLAEGREISEIAGDRGMKARSVRTQLNRARSRVRQAVLN